MGKTQNRHKRELRHGGAWARLISDIANGNGYIAEKISEAVAIEKKYPHLRNEEIDHNFDRPGLRQILDKAHHDEARQ